MTGRSGNFQKCFIFNAVTHNLCQICGCRSMNAGFILSIQSIWRNKIGIFAAQLFCLLIHLLCKPFHTSPNMLRNSHRRIVVGFEHKRIQKIPELESIIRSHAQTHFGHRRRITANLHFIIQISLFQCQNTSHDFGGTGIWHMLITIFFIEHPSTLGIH